MTSNDKLSPSSSLHDLQAELQTLELNINHINETTEQAVQFLEEKKSELRKSSDPNFNQIDAEIQHITTQHDQIVGKLLQQKTDATLRKASLDKLEYAIEELDREISRIQCERDVKIDELKRKKLYITKCLYKIHDLNNEVHDISAKIYETTHHFQDVISEAEKRKGEILSDTDTTDGEKVLALAALDRETEEKQTAHRDNLDSLKRQREESLAKIREIDMDTGTAHEIKIAIQDEVNRLEVARVGATALELEEIDNTSKILKMQQKEIDFMRELNDRGLRINPSGHIVTGSGRILTIAEAESADLLVGLDASEWASREQLKESDVRSRPSSHSTTASGTILTAEVERASSLVGLDTPGSPKKEQVAVGVDKVTVGTNEATVGVDEGIVDREQKSVASTPPSVKESYIGLASEDVEYLKRALGKPLTLALAEICVAQPRDPIHYLGHWLLKYRYNQEVDEATKKEIKDLIAEREKIRKEIWHKEVENAARDAVLEMVFKSLKDVAVITGPQKSVTEQDGVAEENGELAEEAKDFLGELGSPVGQQRAT